MTLNDPKEKNMKDRALKLFSAFVVAVMTLTPLAFGVNTAGADPHIQHIAVWHDCLNCTFTRTSTVNDYATNVCATDVSGGVEVFKNGNDRGRWTVPLCVHNDPNQTDNVNLNLGTDEYTFELEGLVEPPCTGVCRMSQPPPTPQNFCVDFSSNFLTNGDNFYSGNCNPGARMQTNTNNISRVH